jgi:hypothetical protein
MDVFLALLLLLGGYSLGAASQGGVDETVPVEQTGGAAGAGADVPAEIHDSSGVDRVSWDDCDTDRHYVIYRDLSRAPERDGDCEGVCPNE